MLEKVTIKVPWRSLRRGYRFVAKPISILVGEQGSGKSSLIEAIRSKGKPEKESEEIAEIEGTGPFIFFDTERMNPRIQDPGMAPDKFFGISLMSRFQSHGQVLLPILMSLRNKSLTDHTILIDEPESGQSIQSVFRLIHLFKDLVRQGNTVVIATHHPYIIGSEDEVFSMGDEGWVGSKSYIKRCIPDKSELPEGLKYLIEELFSTRTTTLSDLGNEDVLKTISLSGYRKRKEKK